MQMSYLVAVVEEEDHLDHSEAVVEEEDHPDHSEAVEVEEGVLVDFLKGVWKQLHAIYRFIYNICLSFAEQSIV